MEFTLNELDKAKVTQICEEFTLLLEQKGFKDISKIVHYVLRELIYNGFKANLKRIFAYEHSEISEKDIVSSFSKALSEGSDELLAKLLNHNLEVKVEFVEMKDGAIARVHNSSEMLLEEKKFVDEILYVADNRELSSFIDGVGREGAGLGLRSAIRILDEAKIGTDCLSYTSNNGKTIFEFRIKK